MPLKLKNNLGTTDDEQVKNALTELVHQLFVDVETYLTHKSFTKFKGGFKIKINGILIYKAFNDLLCKTMNLFLDIFRSTKMKN